MIQWKPDCWRRKQKHQLTTNPGIKHYDWCNIPLLLWLRQCSFLLVTSGGVLTKSALQCKLKSTPFSPLFDNIATGIKSMCFLSQKIALTWRQHFRKSKTKSNLIRHRRRHISAFRQTHYVIHPIYRTTKITPCSQYVNNIIRWSPARFSFGI